MPSPEAIDRYRTAMTAFWHPVVRSTDLDGKPLAITLLDQGIVLVRLDGVATAMTDVCRHLGASLSLGDVVDGSRLRCRYHGWSYDSTGKCVNIPLRGPDRTIPTQARVQTYHCKEAYGLVWVCLAENAVHDLPPYEEFFDPQFHRNELVQHAEWNGSVSRLAMAALDDTHFSWVHPGTLGVAGQPLMPDRVGQVPVEVKDGVLTSRYRTRLPASPLAPGLTAESGIDTTETIEVEFFNVATVNSVKNVLYQDAGIAVTWNVYMPISFDRTLTFTQLSRTYDKDHSLDESFEVFNLGIKEEDRQIVEAQKPWLLPPLSSRMILYVRPEDGPLVEYQKMLEELDVPQL